MGKPLAGQCLCGGVAFRVERRDLEPVGACHCAQCRRFAGHYWVTVSAPRSGLTFTAGENLVKWRRSSKIAKRGFCSECGASLFYTADRLEARKDRIAIAVGALDQPTGLKLSEHIFVAHKGDYYDIADGLPQKDEY